MRKHQFAVGVLTELAPHEQPHLLGLNVNAGQAIKLRLRTDAYDGFRLYAEVRRVLCHELTHNVWGDHDNNVSATVPLYCSRCGYQRWGVAYVYPFLSSSRSSTRRSTGRSRSSSGHRLPGRTSSVVQVRRSMVRTLRSKRRHKSTWSAAHIPLAGRGQAAGATHQKSDGERFWRRR